MSWICDGVPKNGKSYPDAGGKHHPVDNHFSNCLNCGLPQESMDPPGSPPIPWKVSLTLATSIALISTGSFLLISERFRCETGFERIAGHCVDPYREAYQNAVNHAQAAREGALNAQDVTELNIARTALEEAIVQLIAIPETAPVFPEAVEQSSILRDELRYIDLVINEEQVTKDALKSAEEAQTLEALENATNQLNTLVEQLNSVPETASIAPKAQERLNALTPKVQEVQDQLSQAEAAQAQLEAIESQAATAKESGKKATSIAALEAVESQWNAILDKLNQVPESPLVMANVKAKQAEYKDELSNVQGRIADLVAASRPVLPATTQAPGTSEPPPSNDLPIYNDPPPTYNDPPATPNPPPALECPGDPRCLF